MRLKVKAWAGRAIMLTLIAALMLGLAYTAPLDLALIGAIDLATYIDALLGVYVIAQISRLRPMLAMSRLWIAARLRRPRSRATAVRPAEKALPANDDDRPHALAA